MYDALLYNMSADVLCVKSSGVRINNNSIKDHVTLVSDRQTQCDVFYHNQYNMRDSQVFVQYMSKSSYPDGHTLSASWICILLHWWFMYVHKVLTWSWQEMVH